MRKLLLYFAVSIMSVGMFAQGYDLFVGVKTPTANRPENVKLRVIPASGSGFSFEMTFNDETGWHITSDATANENDKFKFTDAQNPFMVLCKYIPENDAWVQAVMKFDDVWFDDIYKGDPVKWVEIDMSDPNMYAWMEDMPDISAISSMAADAVKGVWFDLNGRKLNGNPAAKGIYIYNGKKLVVK